MTEAELEKMSDQIDAILARHGLNGRVCGGYVAGSGILFSLHDGLFVTDTAVLIMQHIMRGACLEIIDAKHSRSFVCSAH